ncbi:hypothetical protein, partial [Mesorhizobium sp. WSM3876]|uniref:hypothetical protein n=1 Tax=Mesorhizobium sp. WSM3876 TaxID=422277 RepID=UPI001AECC552
RNADLGADLLDLLLLGGARDFDVGLHFGHDGFPLDWAVEGRGSMICACSKRRPDARACSNPVAVAASTFMQISFLQRKTIAVADRPSRRLWPLVVGPYRSQSDCRSAVSKQPCNARKATEATPQIRHRPTVGSRAIGSGHC